MKTWLHSVSALALVWSLGATADMNDAKVNDSADTTEATGDRVAKKDKNDNKMGKAKGKKKDKTQKGESKRDARKAKGGNRDTASGSMSDATAE